MENKEIRRKILEILYEQDEKSLGDEVASLNLMSELDIEQDKLNFNANYLKNAEDFALKVKENEMRYI